MRLDHILNQIDFGKLRPMERTRYINRIKNVVSVIEERFPHVQRPEQIQLKHAQYYRNIWLPAHSPSMRTQDEHMRALGLLVRALGRDDSWLGKLGLTSHSSTGGRPTQIKIRNSRKHYR
ncbi:hypothetical protein ABA45_05845 [Marinobacter psychrophilus]|uniref:Uncharacterized protein n=1 Tax=Marinobacter psychrophilus TaxID=330734 RepID=A0A0H4I2G2_9GAMM|nr:hypothetical protein ABA45_05845 [Marinobacter psychrophilus]